MRRTFIALALFFACTAAPTAPEPARLSPTGVLSGGASAGYARAIEPRRFTFPRDHGPHPEFRTEWWYLTGHLAAGKGGAGRRFGYQLTFFRQALAPAAPARASAWATRQVYLGHLAITDIDGKRFVAYEQTAREGLGLAGAQAAPLRVWVEDWQLEGGGQGQGNNDRGHLRLRATGLPDGVAAALGAALDLDVDLGAGRGPILQGEGGLSRKGAEPGNASYYYSFTRMPTRGRVSLGDDGYEVEGESWLDREWSTSALGPELAGWDWLSLSLADGRDVMVFRLRRRDGTSAPESRATVIAPDGTTQLFDPQQHRFTSTGVWTGSDGTRYPAAFHLEIPAAKLTLDVRPLLPDQELRLGFRYWEGAVEAEGAVGRGYLELTGYAR